MRSDFFQGQTDKHLFYWASYFWETWLSKQEKEKALRTSLLVKRAAFHNV
jgi:hypothetical protein